MSQRRIQDKAQARNIVGDSDVCRYRHGEEASDRHERRLRTNLSSKEIVENWCATNNVTFKVTNNGHHWRFSWGKRCIEWWPSSAKLVIDRKYSNGIHTHGFDQCLKILQREFEKRD